MAERLARSLHLAPDAIPAFIRAARAEQSSDRLPSPDDGIASPLVNRAPPRTIGNLPVAMSSFIGRARELRELHALLARSDVRLLTLTGAGGSGKTRLAIEAASALIEQYPDGVWFVDLAPISDAQLVAPAIVQALGLPEAVEITPREQLLRWFVGKQLLLVLDNFEYVLDAAVLVGEMVRAAPKIQVLVTSRVPLRLSGEQEYPLVPLDLPVTDLPHSTEVSLVLESIERSDAVQLLIKRAALVIPGFQLTPQNATALAAICTRLDGLPLAIELAAARLRLFTPEQLLMRLSDAHLQTLVGGARDLPSRQQTIRATIDWSYKLLTPPQQRLFARLGVFVGGWALEAVEAVGYDPQTDLLAGLAVLVEHSLVHVLPGVSQPRYTMLETLRQYACEQLQALSEHEVVRERHATYFMYLAEVAEPRLRSHEEITWLERLDVEDRNFQGALAWCLQAPDAIESRHLCGWRLAAALWWYWSVRGHFREWRHYVVDQIQPMKAAPFELRGRLMLGAATLIQIIGPDNTPHQHLSESLAFLQAAGASWWYTYALGRSSWQTLTQEGNPTHALQINNEQLVRAKQIADPWLIAEAQIHYGDTLNEISKDVNAKMQLEQGLMLARAVGNPSQIADALMELGRHALYTSDMQQAQVYFTECLELRRRLRSVYGMAVILWGLSGVAFHQCNFEVNRTLQRERLQIEQHLGNDRGVTNVYNSLAEIELSAANFTQAHAYLEYALALAQKTDNQFGILTALVTRVDIAFVTDALDRSAADCFAILAHASDRGTDLQFKGFAHTYLGRIALRKGNVADGRTSLAQGWLCDPFPDNPVNNALHIEVVAELLVAEGRMHQAARLWGAASVLREQVGAPMWPGHRPIYERWVAAACTQIDPAEWESVWTAGQALTRQQAMGEALAWLETEPDARKANECQINLCSAAK